MFLTDHDVEEAAERRGEDPGSSMTAVVIGAAVKTSLAALAGLVLTCGLGLLVWAVTPSSGSGPLPLLRAGVAAFCAASGMTLEIGRSGLTLHPLMLTIVAIALLTAVSGRGRVIARGREQEGAAVLTAAALYAITVTAIGAGLGGGTVSAAQWWRPAMLALVVVGVTTLIRGDGWRFFLLDRLPVWFPVALRCGGAATAAVLGGGAVTLVIGLIRTFGDSTTVQALAAPGAAGGLGMALLGIAYLPNAVVAATGYSTGVGFTIGSGTYTPFGSSPVELPAVTLLTAAPDGHAFARPTLLLLLFPVLAAVLIGRGVVRRLETRNDRLFAAGGAALFAAVLCVVVAEMAAGGVTGGEWSTTGVPPALFGFVVLAVLGMVSSAMVVLTRVPAVTSVVLADDTHDLEQLADTDLVAVTEDAELVEAEPVEAEPVAAEPVAAEPVAAEPVEETEEVEGDTAGLEESAEDDTGAPEAAELTGAAELTEIEASAEPDETEDAQFVEADDAAVVNPAIPNPREEDVVAVDMKADDDPDVKLVSGLPRTAKPRRTG